MRFRWPKLKPEPSLPQAGDETVDCTDRIADLKVAIDAAIADAVSSTRLETIEEYDPWNQMRWIFTQMAERAETPEYCGVPMPIKGQSLIVEPRHPARELFAKGEQSESERSSSEYDDNCTIINTFRDRRRNANVVIFRDPDGKTEWYIVPDAHHLLQDLDTMACSPVWSIEAEANAQKLLSDVVSPYQMRCYLLTGMFLETSKRSGVSYIFRRLRPTVAFRSNEKNSKILACLCMHPIGYYSGTWAGSLVPTDDVVSHLLLMRSDEHMFWRRSNQHPAWSSLAGL